MLKVVFPVVRYKHPVVRDTGFLFTIMVLSKKLKFTGITNYRVELLLQYPLD